MIFRAFSGPKVKKPRKQRPKAKQRRATPPVLVPLRAQTFAPPPDRFETLLRDSGRHLSTVAASAAGFARRARVELTNLAGRFAPDEIAPKLRRLRDNARAFALPYSHDEREALALLFMPFLVVASAIVVHQSVRSLHTYLTAVSLEQELAPVSPGGQPLVLAPRQPITEAAPDSEIALPASNAFVTQLTARDPGERLAAASAIRTLSTLPPLELLSTTQGIDQMLAQVSPAVPAYGSNPQLALLAPARDLGSPTRFPAPASLKAYEADEDGHPILPGICAIDEAPPKIAASNIPPPPPGSEDFGLRLAQAAEAQTSSFVIYNDAYRTISFPMGDVNPFFGVCTDVVIRAYRAMGIDLQSLVHQARMGSGDTSIDHRRTEVLRRFLAKEGESLPVTSFAEDYRPGDIVTYYRPQNRRSQAHIAMVSSVIAPSGRPMIVHNRGWGPQLEDALFVNEITGHYRYRGPAPTRNAELDGTTGSLPAAAALPSTTLVPASWLRSEQPVEHTASPAH